MKNISIVSNSKTQRNLVSALSIVILLMTFNLKGLSQIKDKVSPYFGLGSTYYGVYVKNLPFEIRDVPIHKKDDYVPRENAGAIEFVDYENHLTAGCIFGVKYRITPSFSINGEVNWIWFPGKKYSRNYTNAVGTQQRGYGAALTYARIGIRGIVPAANFGPLDVLTSVVPKVGFERRVVEHESGFYLALQASISHSHLIGANGWDRYNSLQRWRTYKLANLYPLSAQLDFAIPEESSPYTKPEYQRDTHAIISIGIHRIFIDKYAMADESVIRFEFANNLGFFISFTGTM